MSLNSKLTTCNFGALKNLRREKHDSRVEGEKMRKNPLKCVEQKSRNGNLFKKGKCKTVELKWDKWHVYQRKKSRQISKWKMCTNICELSESQKWILNTFWFLFWFFSFRIVEWINVRCMGYGALVNERYYCAKKKNNSFLNLPFLSGSAHLDFGFVQCKHRFCSYHWIRCYY